MDTVSVAGTSTSTSRQGSQPEPLNHPEDLVDREQRERPAADWVRTFGLDQRSLLNRQNETFNLTMTHVINLVEESRVQVGSLTDKIVGLEGKIGSLVGQVDQLQGQVRMNSVQRGESVSFGTAGQTVVFAQQDTPPLFDPAKKFGSGRYLEDLEGYFVKRGTPEEKRLEIALEGLQGHAKNWATVCRSTWNNFEDFRNGFQNYFWSVQDQGKVRQQISNGKWSKDNSLSEHFADMASLANLLTTPIPEETLVAEVMRHFPTHIQALWSLKQQHNLGEALAFLKQQEDIGNGRDRLQPFGNQPNPKKVGTTGRNHPYYPYSKVNTPRETLREKYPIQTMQVSTNQGNEQQSS